MKMAIINNIILAFWERTNTPRDYVCRAVSQTGINRRKQCDAMNVRPNNLNQFKSRKAPHLPPKAPPLLPLLPPKAPSPPPLPPKARAPPPPPPPPPPPSLNP